MSDCSADRQGQRIGASTYAEQAFNAPAERCERLTGVVLSQARNALRVLDIGCGAGDQIASLARALPLATFTGVDLSPASIAAARERSKEEGIASRVELVEADYLEFRPERRFDLVISYSTLHLVPAPAADLFGKIASEIEDGGLLVNAIPYECGYNRALIGVRRFFRAIRSPLSDAFVLGAARLLHGHRLGEQMLRQRVMYMYQVPEVLEGRKLERMLREQCGLVLVASRDEPHASPAQLKHRLSLYRRVGGAR